MDKYFYLNELISKDNLGEKLTVRGFYNGDVELPQLRFLNIKAEDIFKKKVFTLRSNLNPKDKNTCIIAVDYDIFNNLPVLNSFSYLEITGKVELTRKIRLDKITTYQPAIIYLNAERIKPLSVNNFLSKKPPLSAKSLTKITEEFLNNKRLASGIILNLINLPSVDSYRSYSFIPISLTTEFHRFERDRIRLFKNTKEFLATILPSFTFKDNLFMTIKWTNEKNINKLKFSDNTAYFIQTSYFCYGNESYISKSDYPILTQESCSFNFKLDAEYLAEDLFSSILWYRLNESKIDIKKYDKAYTTNFIDKANSLNPTHRYYFLGMSSKGFFNFPDASYRYGSGINLASSFKKLNKPISKIYELNDSLCESFIRSYPKIFKNELWNLGYKIDHLPKKMAKVINLIKDATSTNKLNWISGLELEHLFDKNSIKRSILYELQEQGILVLRPKNHYTLFPTLIP